MATARAILAGLTWVTATLGGCALGPPPGAPPPPPETVAAAPSQREARDNYIAQALKASRPAALDGHRLFSIGTGFFIASNRVLTNFHVAGDCTLVTVGNDSEGEETVAKLVAGDPTLDLALLGTEKPIGEPARFETAIYTVTGEGLAVVGYPEHGLAVRQAELDRVTARPADLVAERARFRFDGAVRRGNSGGPILDDTGAVIGVVTAKLDTVAMYQRTGQVIDNVGFAIGNHTVFDFLRANKAGFLPALPGPSLTPDAVLAKAHGFVRQIGCWK